MKEKGLLHSMAFWRRGRDAPAAVLLPPPADPDQKRRAGLADAFRQGRYGILCRTLSFPGNVEGSREYYRALCVSSDFARWNIQRITEHPVQTGTDHVPVATPNMSLYTVKAEIDFFEALGYLARFEVTQKQDPLNTPDGLGDTHYERFGLLHDVVFDLRGMPQPTRSGHLVLDGDYPADVLDRLQQAQGEKDLKTTLRSQALVDARNVTAAQLSATFRDLCHQNEQADQIKTIADLVETWMNVLGVAWGRKDFCAPWQQKEKRPWRPMTAKVPGNYEDDYFWNFGYPRRAQDMYKTCKEQLDKMENLDPAMRRSIKELLFDCAELAMLQDVKFFMRSMRETENPGHQELIKKVTDHYVGLHGMGLSTKRREQIAAGFTARAISEPFLRKVPQGLRDTVATLRGQGETVSAQTREMWKMLRPDDVPAP